MLGCFFKQLATYLFITTTHELKNCKVLEITSSLIYIPFSLCSFTLGFSTFVCDRNEFKIFPEDNKHRMWASDATALNKQILDTLLRLLQNFKI